MISNRFWGTTLFLLSAVGPLSSGVWAQTTTMAACPTGWEWNQNSLGQDPCTISSILDAACRGEGSYTIPPINSTQNYVPPQLDSTYDLTCDCDTVMYSLYMACTTCQGGVIYSWTKWIAQCTTVYVTQYPHNIAQGTAIPHWAFYDVTTLPTETYNDTVAISVGRNPEATPSPLSTATLKTSTSSRSGSQQTLSSSGSNPTQSGGSSGGTKVSLAAIVGAAVGGVVLIVCAVVAGIIISRRGRSRQNQRPPLQPLPPQETAEYQKVQPMSPMLSPGAPNLPYNTPTSPGLPYTTSTSPGIPYNAPPNQNPPYNPHAGMNPPTAYYNPEDPTTFPPPMGDGQSSVTYTNATTPHGPNGPGWYGGMPEL
ncbi:hypothetical protein BJ322DRAFT_406973 [Thelephora terrestris]|uniref:Transmembrane protein n=1 Tax=Thelephora terrestris TaxID=56493 RepID=A0A9P6HP06_9AGAM|nr:hypothetical protein BJ322DRAFT_406973 [Thelephora terrestris]